MIDHIWLPTRSTYHDEQVFDRYKIEDITFIDSDNIFLLFSCPLDDDDPEEKWYGTIAVCEHIFFLDTPENREYIEEINEYRTYINDLTKELNKTQFDSVRYFTRKEYENE